VAIAARWIPATLSWRLARQVSSRFSWGIADQAMSTLTNFLLSIYVARTLGATQFGAFTLAYLTYGFAINASRGLSIEPLLIRFSGTHLPTWRRATAGCTGTALLVGLISGICATVLALIGGPTGLAFLALGLTLPGLLLQDSWRYAFFAVGRGHLAFINDTIWAVIQIPALVLLKYSGHANVFWFVLAWGLSACVGAVIGSLQARVMPNLAGAVKWLVQHRDLGPRYLLENTGGNAADTLRSYTVSWILGLAAVGYVQAANVLMGPFKIIYFGIGIIAIPEGARLLRSSPRRLPLFCAGVSAALTILALAWGAALVVALPRGLGHLVLGVIWRPSYPLVMPAALAIAASCATTGAGIGLHSLGAARRSLRAVLLTSALVVAAALTGALTAGTAGTMWCAAVASWAGTLVCWRELKLALHDHGVPVPGWMGPRPERKNEGKHSSTRSGAATLFQPALFQPALFQPGRLLRERLVY
jgi:O-antigen/teichoic acid export membrane protein